VSKSISFGQNFLLCNMWNFRYSLIMQAQKRSSKFYCTFFAGCNKKFKPLAPSGKLNVMGVMQIDSVAHFLLVLSSVTFKLVQFVGTRHLCKCGTSWRLTNEVTLRWLSKKNRHTQNKGTTEIARPDIARPSKLWGPTLRNWTT